MGNPNKYPYINIEDDRYMNSLEWYRVFSQDIQLMREEEYDLNEIYRIFKTAIHDWHDLVKVRAAQIWSRMQESLQAKAVITSVVPDEGIPSAPPGAETSGEVRA